ncbi:MAG TPA: hypothetical protein VKC51_07465 [Lacunisphaera sp.]|nr:hypothetical protein [Lacunisphaera sp.]
MNPLLAALALGCLAVPALAGQPFHDAVHPGVPQRIPGAVFCAY